MSNAWQIFRGLLILVAALGCVLWIIWRSLKKSEDPGGLVSRFIVTGILLGILIFKIAPIVAEGGIAAAFSIPFVAAIGIMLAITWAPSWATMLFKPLFNVFDGGEPDGEMTPQYSLAEAKRVKGRFREAITEIRKQLERFPTDLRLQLMMAEINVTDLNDLQAGEVIILKLAQQKHSPVNIASAFQQLADWHLKYGQDPVSAREALEKIINQFPGTPFAQTAAQRIAHLSSMDRLLEHHELPTLKLKEYERDLGLKKKGQGNVADESLEVEKRAADLVLHLEKHPLDTSAREELAKLYALHYGRLDLAINELECLMASPQQNKKDFVRWLELSADLHIKIGNDLAQAQAALFRIIELFPGTSYAEMANRRLGTLNGELSVHKKSQVIKLGSYEKDIGLKARKPIGPPRVE